MIGAAPSTIDGLHEAIKARLAVVAQQFFALETKTDRRAPKIGDGWLPPKATPDVEDYPFLLVRPASGADSEQAADQNATAKVKIIVGTYSDTDDGFRDVLQLIDAIRGDLAEEPTIAGTGFEHIGPLDWELVDPPVRPEWLGVVTTNWQIPRPRRIAARNPTED